MEIFPKLVVVVVVVIMNSYQCLTVSCYYQILMTGNGAPYISLIVLPLATMKGGTPLYGLYMVYRYVQHQRVWLLAVLV